MAEGTPLLREYGFKKPIEGSNPSLSATFSFMVALAGLPATIPCEPRQARKGAAAAMDSGAGGGLAGVASIDPHDPSGAASGPATGLL